MQRKYIILLNGLVWLLIMASHVAVNYNNHLFFAPWHEVPGLTLFIKYLLIETGYLAIAAFCFYSGYFLVAPQILSQKTYFIAFCYTALTAAGILLMRYLLEYHFYLPVLHFNNYRDHVLSVSRYIQNAIFYYLPSYFVYGIIYYVIEGWYRHKQQQEELTNEKLTTELAFLRAQVNPHFLFNTINDIYSLSYQKSDQAPEALLKLSELLRYMLREGQQDMMPLSSEVNYLNNVIELQRISAKGKAYIDFSPKGLISSQPVAALLFIGLMENAFKHGVLNDPLHPVSIQLQADEKNIDFRVYNTKNYYQKDKTGGIGLNNIKRRLELMYPNHHHLHIEETTDTYSAHLTLNLL